MKAISDSLMEGRIRGWLMLLTAFLAGRILGALKGFDGVILSLTQTGFPPLFTIAGLLQIAMLVTAAIAIYYLIKRNSKFRLIVVINSTITILFSLALVRLSMMLTNTAFQLEMLHGLVGAIVFAAIWIPYVYKSQRVKNRLELIDVVAEVLEDPNGREPDFGKERAL